MDNQPPDTETAQDSAPEERAKLLSDYRRATQALVAAQARLQLVTSKLQNSGTRDDNMQKAQEAVFAARTAYYAARDAYHALPPEPGSEPESPSTPMDPKPEPSAVRPVTRLEVQPTD